MRSGRYSSALTGKAGSGKSTPARELATLMGEDSVVVEGDDFYRAMSPSERALLSPSQGYELYFDWERLRDQVLVPVSQGDPTLKYQRYKWSEQRLGEWVEHSMPPAVVVEGVYTLRPTLRAFIDIGIFVRASPAVRMRRLHEREGNSAEWIARWVAAEGYYIETVKPMAVADIVVDGEPSLHGAAHGER